ncbi:MAG TPA: NlpC/P60 family protein [Oscillatoriaceae cyanobacterium]
MSTSAVNGAGRSQPTGGSGSNKIESFLHDLTKFVGQPYLWGGGHGAISSGATPVDCSGLVCQAAGQAGVNLSGTAADLQGHCSSVPMNEADLKPGDLLFVGNPAEHVGVYLGNGKVIQSPHTGASVYISDFPAGFTNAGRPQVFGGQGAPALNVSNTSEGGGASSGGSGGGDANSVGGGGSPSSLGLGAGGNVGSTIAQGLAQMNSDDAKRKQEDGLTGGGLSLPSGGNSFSGAGGAGGASKNAGPAGAPVGAAPSGNLKDWIDQAMKILEQNGVPASALNANDINTIIQHESGGDPNAQNNWDSNAAAGTPSIGLMQTIQPTFDANKLPGHGDIRNPVDNIIAGVRYALGRYGSLSNVPGIKSLASGGSYVGY